MSSIRADDGDHTINQRLGTLLCVENIRASYGKKEILHDITLDVGEGDLVAIIGPNGAGKSTLLKVIAGFLKPAAGRIRVNGIDVTERSAHQRTLGGIGYFMQGGRVFPSLTAAENLRIGGATLQGAERQTNMEQVLDLFSNLKGFLAKRAGLLSGGERQALALGMVLMRHPVLLLLDEPSTGLSPRLVHELLRKIQKVNEDWGLTLVIVEQNVREALTVARRALALVNGQVVTATDKPRAWLDGEQLERLFLGGSLTVSAGQAKVSPLGGHAQT